MKHSERFTFSGCGGISVPAYLWLPEGSVTRVCMVTHGMTEYAALYAQLAEALTPFGIAVASFDLRGHGENGAAQSPAFLGENGWEACLGDMQLFAKLLKERFPDAPLHMLGFSLGSFLLREYLSRFPEDVASAVIMGTGHQPAWLLSVMIALVKRQAKRFGSENTTPFVNTLSFGAYNARFKPNRTGADWLIRDEAALDAYLLDPLCRKTVSSGLFLEMLSAMKRAGSRESVSKIPPELPILLLSGKEDPVGDFGKGVSALSTLLKKTGHTRVEIRLIDKARHILLREHASGASQEALSAIKNHLLSV